MGVLQVYGQTIDTYLSKHQDILRYEKYETVLGARDYLLAILAVNLCLRNVHVVDKTYHKAFENFKPSDATIGAVSGLIKQTLASPLKEGKPSYLKNADDDFLSRLNTTIKYRVYADIMTNTTSTLPSTLIAGTFDWPKMEDELNETITALGMDLNTNDSGQIALKIFPSFLISSSGSFAGIEYYMANHTELKVKNFSMFSDKYSISGGLIRYLSDSILDNKDDVFVAPLSYPTGISDIGEKVVNIDNIGYDDTLELKSKMVAQSIQGEIQLNDLLEWIKKDLPEGVSEQDDYFAALILNKSLTSSYISEISESYLSLFRLYNVNI